MGLGGAIEGKSTLLRTPREDDLAAYNRWMADMRVRRLSRPWHEPAMPATWKERLAEQAKDKNVVLWSIDAAAGLVGLARAGFGGGPASDVAHVDRLVIDPASWRRGLGFDAVLALHRYFFDYLDLRRSVITITAENAAARRIADRLGYVEYAQQHQSHYRDGAYVDELELLMERATWHERWAHEREYRPIGAVAPREPA